MTDDMGFPPLPPDFEFYTEEDQAKWIVNNWAKAAEAYSQCEQKKTGLIDWINE